MSSVRSHALAAVLALSSLAAQATTVQLASDGQWQSFPVDALASQAGDTAWIDDSDGSLLHYSFTIAAGQQGTLSVVDGVFAGDTFRVFNQGLSLGDTSSVPAQVYGSAPNVGYDFDAAWSNPDFSRSVFTLGAGTYDITGTLLQSVTLSDGSALNATVGALKLAVTPAVPEPSSWAMAGAGLALLVLMGRRRLPN